MYDVDFLSLKTSKGGFEIILVVTDHFTRYAQAYPTNTQTAKTTVKVHFENLVIHYEFLARIHLDQGLNFESDLIKGLCELAGIAKCSTTLWITHCHIREIAKVGLEVACLAIGLCIQCHDL